MRKVQKSLFSFYFPSAHFSSIAEIDVHSCSMGMAIMKLLTESEKIHTFRIIFIRLLSLCFGLCVDAAMSTNSNSFFSSLLKTTHRADELWVL